MKSRRTTRSLPQRTPKSLLLGGVVALAALIAVAIGGATPAAGGGPVPHLEVHGKVVAVRVDPYTGIATRTWESTFNVSAKDTCPPPTTDPPVCLDPVVVSFGVHPPERGNPYVYVTSYPDTNSMDLGGGYGITFVDGGEPGTAPAGPPLPGDEGIVPTRDYGQFYLTPSASQVRVYFVTGGVQITGFGH